MPPDAPDEGLFPIPPDVLKLARKHSIKGHNTWPRPSITDVNRALNLLGAEYCQDFDRVSHSQKADKIYTTVSNLYKAFIFNIYLLVTKCVIF